MYVEVVVAGLDRSGSKDDLPRVDGVALELAPADGGRRADGGQVLRAQAGRVAVGANVDDADIQSQRPGQSDRGAKDLASALSLRTVNDDRTSHERDCNWWADKEK